MKTILMTDELIQAMQDVFTKGGSPDWMMIDGVLYERTKDTEKPVQIHFGNITLTFGQSERNPKWQHAQPR